MSLLATCPHAASSQRDHDRRTASEFDPDVTGQFFASAPKKMTGPIEPMRQRHILDRDSQEAGWEATVEAAGIGMPATA